MNFGSYLYLSTKIPFENHLENYLSNNWIVFQKKGYKGVIFLFDEFHLMEDNQSKKFSALGDFIGAINELQSNKIPYHLVLTGLPKLPLNIKNSRSYSERMFNIIILKNLSKDAATLAISEPLQNSSYSFSKEVIDAIVNDTGQYPYFLQFFAREIIYRIDKKNITLEDYIGVKNSIISKLDHSFFNYRMEPLSESQRSLLYSMAKIHDVNMSFSSIEQISDIDKGSISTYLKRLEDKGMIYRYKHGIYRFSLPLFKTYLLRKSQTK